MAVKNIVTLVVIALCLTKAFSDPSACRAKPTGTILSNELNCQQYIVCLYQTAFIKPCPKDQGFSAAARGCVDYNKSDCQAKTLKPLLSPRNWNSGGTCINEKRPENVRACKDQPFGELVPYPGDCAKFLVCNCEYPTVKDCAAGTLFDRKLGMCNFPYNVDCIEGSGASETTKVTPRTTTIKTTTTTTTTSKSTAGKQNCTTDAFGRLQCSDIPIASTKFTTPRPLITTTKAISITTPEKIPTPELTTLPPQRCEYPLGVEANICFGQQMPVYQTYPYNCHAYIVCQDMKPCLNYCENNTIFDSRWGICDNDTKCKEKPITTSITTESTSVSIPLNDSASYINPNFCQGKKDMSIYPYAEDCTKYILCVKNIVKMEMCPNGWLFNAKLMLCDKASEDVCYRNIMPITTTTRKPVFNPCQNQLAGMTFPHTQNCQLYYHCRGNGSFYIISCPFNNYYDARTKKCGPNVSDKACLESVSTTTEATTLSPSQKCLNKPVGFTYAYKETCSQYIYCQDNGNFLLLKCPNNNYYYPDSGKCGPIDAKRVCGENSSTILPQASTTSAPQVSPQPILNICGNFSNGHLVPYPNNCRRYICCNGLPPLGLYCQANWHFNEQLQKCIPDNEDVYNGLYPNHTTGAVCQGHKIGDRRVYKNHCQLYYEYLEDCYYMLKACAEQTYFDPVKGQCSANVGPEYCKKQFESNASEDICKGQAIDKKVGFPNNCTKYIQCKSPIPVAFNCNHGLQFSFAAQDCIETSQSDCGDDTKYADNKPKTTTSSPTPTKPSSECSNKNDFTLMAYKNNCSMFILCLNKTEHLAHCQRGQYFDITAGECLSSGNKESCKAATIVVTTAKSTTMTTTTTKAKATTINSNEVKTTTATETTMTPATTPSISEATKDNICCGQKSGTYLPHPDNKAKFVICQYPLPKTYTCPAGTLYRADKASCN